jgi:hypothetical protein
VPVASPGAIVAAGPMDGAAAGLATGPPTVAANAANPPRSAQMATIASTATPDRRLHRRSAAPASRSGCSSSAAEGDGGRSSTAGGRSSTAAGPSWIAAGPSSIAAGRSAPPVLARHASQSNTGGRAAAAPPAAPAGFGGLFALIALFGSFGSAGSTGAVIANATVGAESSAESPGAAADCFAVFGADVSLTRPGDQVPLDVPDDHGIRQRRRPSTVPRSPPPGRPRDRRIELPSLFCHRCGPANQRHI